MHLIIIIIIIIIIKKMAIFWVMHAASRAQHISDLDSKFALGPHHVQKYGRHPICDN